MSKTSLSFFSSPFSMGFKINNRLLIGKPTSHIVSFVLMCIICSNIYLLHIDTISPYIHKILCNQLNIYKESVESTFVYQNGGCGKTLTKINDTMPHTWIVWGRYAECVQPHNYTRNECCSLSFSLWKLPHFHFRTSKTLSICLLL